MDYKNEYSLNVTSTTPTTSLDNTTKHRFFMVNNVLCRTETADGSFRPSDIFVGYNSPSTTPHGEVVTGGKDEKDSIGYSAGVDLSGCFVFNTFGILSGGVLIDSESRAFLDFTDNIVIAPKAPSTGEFGVREKNNKYYHSLAYSKIRSEAVLCLCSSIEPFNAHGSEHSPLSWPRCASYMSTVSDAQRLARESVSRTLRQCAPGAVGDTDLLSFLELFRYRVKQNHTQSGFLPSSIAYGLQYGGKPLDVKAAALAASKRKVASRYSDFCVFSAISKESHNLKGTYDESRTRIELRVQQLLQPLRREFRKNETPLYKSKSVLWNLWYTFYRYFDILGVRRCGQCNASDASAVVVVDRHRGRPPKDQGPVAVAPCASGTTTWRLEDDIQISYADVVHAFEKMDSAPRNESLSGQLRTSEASDAWHWLLNHDRARLLHRVKKVQRYVEKNTNARRGSRHS